MIVTEDIKTYEQLQKVLKEALQEFLDYSGETVCEIETVVDKSVNNYTEVIPVLGFPEIED